jgi:plasmid maintenance system antidote protein VapI
MSGQQLKGILDQRGIKQKWVAEKIGCSKQHLSNFIKGRYKLSDSKIHRLQQVLGLKK